MSASAFSSFYRPGCRCVAHEPVLNSALQNAPHGGRELVNARRHPGKRAPPWEYSDRVVLGANLRQGATEPAIRLILSWAFFYPLYMYLRTISTLQNLSFSCCCVAVRQPRVSQKTSNVNDAELPHLEGTVTLDRSHVSH
jgi:hypothetical protein